MDEQVLKILMLEDNANDVKLIQHVLEKDKLNFESKCVDTRAEFDEAVHTFHPDVVLSDHGLPQFNSKDALKICLTQRDFIPFIVVTGTMTDEFAVSILHDGADDYVLKSNLTRLPSAIRRAVKQRTLEKMKRESKRELLKKNDELLEVKSQIDNFVYNVSHNLKGPLASMMGLVNIAKELNTTKDEKVSEVHAMMDSSIQQLDETLAEIIEYARNSRSEITVTEIDWLECIGLSIDKVSYLDEHREVPKKIEINGCYDFFSDSSRLQILFTNLLSNSLHYQSKERAPYISVTVNCGDTEAIITIIDNGIGISEEAMPHIFNMFYRGTEESHGAGLGLFIVKETVTKLNGSINIMSCAGTNTHVTITLPNLKSGAVASVMSEAI